MEQNLSLRQDVLLLHLLDGKSLSFEERNEKVNKFGVKSKLTDDDHALHGSDQTE